MAKISFSRTLDDLENRLRNIKPKDTKIIKDANRLSDSLHAYIKDMWPIIEGGRPFVDGWHIQAICEHLEAVYLGQIKKLIINIPPRSSKSSLVSVAFPTWAWTRDPSLQFLYISYVAKLSIKDNVRSRRVIDSPWYKERWGEKFKISSDVNTKLRFDNDKSGYRIASSVGGSATGEGGDILVLDDPNSAFDTQSDVKREATNDWCDHVLSTRLNNPKTGRTIVVQQRLHTHDYTGHTLLKNIPDLVHLCLPMEYEAARKCITVPLRSTSGKRWQDPRVKEGQLLWPERVGIEELSKLKAEMDSSYVVSGQLQQRPSPDEGGIIKKGWFQWWKEKEMPRCEFVLQSWDTALSTKATACYSACTNWGIFRDKYGVENVILLSTWRGRVEYPDLRKMAIRLGRCIYDTNFEDPMPEDYIYRPNMILVEAKANGLSLIQDLNRAGLIITKFDPSKNGGDKIARARLAVNILEGGRVWLPARAPNFDKLKPFAEEFLEAAAIFPNNESNDFIDSMSQAFIKMTSSGMIGHPDDEKIRTGYSENKRLY